LNSIMDQVIDCPTIEEDDDSKSHKACNYLQILRILNISKGKE